MLPFVAHFFKVLTIVKTYLIEYPWIMSDYIPTDEDIAKTVAKLPKVE